MKVTNFKKQSKEIDVIAQENLRDLIYDGIQIARKLYNWDTHDDICTESDAIETIFCKIKKIVLKD